ncbi:MAG: cytochrome d ubiquinol oxidase subunit II [Muribaculaceae bacterium]|nr:cytochrome d ubiquinol oxidase subunit II [Muribaculaceae bacterium]
MTIELLQNYWWLIISLLGALLVFLLFVQGGQSMLIGVKNADQRSLMINSLGRKWELTFTTLVTFGGAFFASFPLFYSTSFGGTYWLWMLILFSFVIQAISYEYRSKKGNVYGTKFYDTLLCINGILGPLLLGVAVGSMFFGNEFCVTKAKILDVEAPTISTWGPKHGFEAIVCWKNLVFGVMILFLARTLASLYFINNVNDEGLQKAQNKQLIINGGAFVVLFLITIVLILTSNGVDTTDDAVQWIEYKYLHNFIDMWWCLFVLLAGTGLVLWGIGKTLKTQAKWNKGIWPAGIGVVLVVLSLFWVLGFNNTAFYPSLLDANSSLTIRNSSSSLFTLKVMSAVSLLVPFVLAYIAYVWRAMDSTKISLKEIRD